MIQRKDTDGIRILQLAHGKVSAMDIELGEAFTREMQDATVAPIKAVIVTGTGSSFSAGVDLFRVVKDGAEYGRRFLPVLDAFLRAALTLAETSGRGNQRSRHRRRLHPGRLLRSSHHG